MISKFLRPCARKISEGLSAFPRLQTFLKQTYRKLPRSLRGHQLVHDHLREFAKMHSAPFFIQVGANDGITNDHLYPFIKRYRWKGILLEPVPLYFDRLCDVYRSDGLILENVAINSEDGVKDFYYFEDNGKIPKWAGGCGSFLLDNLTAQIQELPELEYYLKKTEVPCLSLSSLMKKHNRATVDLIVIDAEGYDWEVLRQVELDEWNVSMVVFEHIVLPKETLEKARAFLTEHSFELHSDAYDTVAVRTVV